MQINTTTHPEFTITHPKIGDEIEIASMHIKSWKETYITSEFTERDIDVILGHMLIDTDFRKNIITQSLENPDKIFYRIVKNNKNEIVGFFHGSKGDIYNNLEGFYLLNEVKGSGIADYLISEFLNWIDKNKSIILEVFSSNIRAIKFYKKYNFIKTGKPVQIWRERLPFVEMIRSTDN